MVNYKGIPHQTTINNLQTNLGKYLTETIKTKTMEGSKKKGPYFQILMSENIDEDTTQTAQFVYLFLLIDCDQIH